MWHDAGEAAFDPQHGQQCEPDGKRASAALPAFIRFGKMAHSKELAARSDWIGQIDLDYG